MRNLKRVGLFVVAACALLALIGASSASATKIYKYTTPSANDPLGVGTVIKARMTPETSGLFKDTVGGVAETCTSMEGEGVIEVDEGSPRGKATVFTFGGCSHTLTSLSLGELEIKSIAGTTNGTLISRGTRATFKSTIFGVSCIGNTGAGTTMGTITGAKSSSAKAGIDINAVITLENGCGDVTLTGSGEVTSPLGLTIEG